MYASQQLHPVLPFNMTYPRERVGWQVDRSMMTEAVKEVLQPHLDNLNTFVGSYKGGSGASPSPTAPPVGGDESGDVSTVLAEVQKALKALNEARKKQGDPTQEMEELRAALEQLEREKKALGDANEATLALMEKAARIVAGLDRDTENTLSDLKDANPTFSEALGAMSLKLTQVEGELGEKKGELAALNSDADRNKKGAVAGSRDKIEVLEGEKRGLIKKVRELEGRVRDAKKEASDAYQQQLDERQGQLNAANKRLKGLDKNQIVESLKADVATANEALEQLRSSKEELDRKLATGTENYETLQGQYEELTAEKQQLGAQVQQLTAKIEGIERKKNEEPASPSHKGPSGVPVTPGGENDSSGDEFDSAKDASSGPGSSQNSTPKSSPSGKGPREGAGAEEATGAQGGDEGGAEEATGEEEGEEEEEEEEEEKEEEEEGEGEGREEEVVATGYSFSALRDYLFTTLQRQGKKDIVKGNKQSIDAALMGDGGVIVGEDTIMFEDTNMGKKLATIRGITNDTDRVAAAGNFINMNGLTDKDGKVIVKAGFHSFDLGKLFMWL